MSAIVSMLVKQAMLQNRQAMVGGLHPENVALLRAFRDENMQAARRFRR